MEVSPFNPPRQKIPMFKVTFGYVNGFGQPTSSTLYLQSHSIRSLKRRIYSTIDNVRSLSIVAVTVKN